MAQGLSFTAIRQWAGPKNRPLRPSPACLSGGVSWAPRPSGAQGSSTSAASGTGQKPHHCSVWASEVTWLTTFAAFWITKGVRSTQIWRTSTHTPPLHERTIKVLLWVTCEMETIAPLSLFKPGTVTHTVPPYCVGLVPSVLSKTLSSWGEHFHNLCLVAFLRLSIKKGMNQVTSGPEGLPLQIRAQLLRLILLTQQRPHIPQVRTQHDQINK